MSELLDKMKAYLKKIADIDLDTKPLEKAQMQCLPLTITAAYNCYKAEMIGVEVVLLEPLDTENCTPAQLLKHQQIVTNATGRHTIFLLDNIAAYTITRLPAERVNFIVPGRMVFIPSLLIELRKISIAYPDEITAMPPLAQALILLQLNGESVEDKDLEELRLRLYTSHSSLRRAIIWLAKNDLVRIGEDKRKIAFVAEKQELWKLALPKMPSPIERVYYTDEIVDLNDNRIKISGETALSELSLLSSFNNVIAVDKTWATAQSKRLDKKNGSTTIEVWRFSPWLINKYSNIVDPLSLYLCMRDNIDERIQIELENLIKNFKW